MALTCFGSCRSAKHIALVFVMLFGDRVTCQQLIRSIKITESDSLYVADIDRATVNRGGTLLGLVEGRSTRKSGLLVDLRTGGILMQIGPSYDFSDSLARTCSSESINERHRIWNARNEASGSDKRSGTDYYNLVPSNTRYEGGARLTPSWIESSVRDILFVGDVSFFLGYTSGVANDTIQKNSMLIIAYTPFLFSSDVEQRRSTYIPLSIDRRDYASKRDSAARTKSRYEVTAEPGRACMIGDGRQMLLPIDYKLLANMGAYHRPRTINLLHGEVDPVTMDVQPGLYYPVAPRMGDVERYYLSVIPCVSKNHGYRYIINGLPWVYDRNGRALFELDTQGLSFLPVALQDSVTTSLFKRYVETQASTVIELSENEAGEVVVVLRVASPSVIGKSDIIIQRYAANGKPLRSHRFSTTSACEYACASYHAPGDTVFVASFRDDSWIIEEVRL